MTKPPVAQQLAHTFSHHGITVEDPYHWLKDEGYPDVTDPQVLAYLEAENAYFQEQMAPHQALVDELFKEIKGRQPDVDASVPYRKGNYWYQWRFEADSQYRKWLRAPATNDPRTHLPTQVEPAAADSWEVILDEPLLAAQHDYFNLGGMAVSPNGRYLAWSADISGAERFTLNITDLDSGTLLDEPIDAESSVATLPLADDDRNARFPEGTFPPSLPYVPPSVDLLAGA